MVFLVRNIMKDLVLKELREINGGSPESFNAGVEVGHWIRKQFDNTGILYALILCLL